MSIYLDAKFISSAAQTGPLKIIPQATAHIKFGQNDAGSPYFGYMDEVKIWGRALRQEEILMLWNSGITTNRPYSDNAGNFYVNGVYHGNGSGLTNIFSTNIAPTTVTVGTTIPDFWSKTYDVNGHLIGYTPVWTNH